MDENQEQLIDKVVYINRVAKVVKGGKRFRFSALVVVGDGNARWATASARQRGVDQHPQGVRGGKEAMRDVPIVSGTIPHAITGEFGSSRVLVKPAEGTGSSPATP
jgi:small subunit ribosomal protein S5